jgi:hypothetical protein
VTENVTTQDGKEAILATLTSDSDSFKPSALIFELKLLAKRAKNSVKRI